MDYKRAQWMLGVETGRAAAEECYAPYYVMLGEYWEYSDTSMSKLMLWRDAKMKLLDMNNEEVAAKFFDEAMSKFLKRDKQLSDRMKALKKCHDECEAKLLTIEYSNYAT